ncbi:MAG: hypothetical protein JWN43_120 [Gammaproteobacteria bacterium]|nr:hypothetical protein [Gammaproteobacteria bacterium]
MYAQFFGLGRLPFRLRPDSDFLYSGPEYQQSRTGLLAALHGGSRVLLLSGPPGVGKTMLLEDVLGDIAGRFALCRINQPHISPTELLQALLLQLSPPAEASSVADPPRSFTRLAAALDPPGARGAPPLLVVDDAQLLAGGTLRVFTEILPRAPRLKILLVGQDDRMQRTGNLASRIVVPEKLGEIQLEPLSAEGSKAYVERRLTVAGGSKELFTPESHAMIFHHTGGAARLINVLCDAALQAACMRASGQVTAAEILLATQDSRWPEAVARDKARRGAPDDAPAPTAQLFVSVGTEHVAAWPLKPGRISIGRALDNELRLDAPYISRHHCQVVTVGMDSTIEDLGSVNGICVNGRLMKRHLLQHADRITLGEHVLTYLVD